MEFTTEGIVKVERVEDGGQALIGESFRFETDNSDEDTTMFVTLQSWDGNVLHTDMNLLVGKRVKITVQVIE